MAVAAQICFIKIGCFVRQHGFVMHKLLPLSSKVMFLFPGSDSGTSLRLSGNQMFGLKIISPAPIASFNHFVYAPAPLASFNHVVCASPLGGHQHSTLVLCALFGLSLVLLVQDKKISFRVAANTILPHASLAHPAGPAVRKPLRAPHLLLFRPAGADANAGREFL